MYQSLKSDISAQILEKNRKTLESARKNAVDLYSKTMKAKQIGTIEEFDYLHNQSLEAAMKQFNEIKISNAEDIQENIESKLKNVNLNLIKITTFEKYKLLLINTYNSFRKFQFCISHLEVKPCPKF